MSSSLFRWVGSAIGTGTQLTPSSVVMMVANSIDEFRAWTEHLGQPARQALGVSADGWLKAGGYPVLRAAAGGFTDAQLAAAANNTAPTKVITLQLADGTIVFAGTVK